MTGLTRKQLLDAEGGTLIKRSGSVRVALLYPNPYSVAMSSLGYQVVYRMFNDHPEIVAERAVLPDDVEAHRRARTPLVTLETGFPVGGADVVAISLAYEPDVARLFTMMELARIPALRAERGPQHPLVLLGGPITMSNVLPLAPFVDAVVVGDGEPVVPRIAELLATHIGRSSGGLLEALAALPGVYVPSLHGSRVPDMLVSPASDLPAIGQIWTPHAELSNMMLVEASRGCPRYCTFCVMRAAAQPMREAPLEAVLPVLDSPAPRIGLVGAAISEYTHIRALLRAAIAAGKGVGISSLRADRLDEEFVSLLHEGGYRTMTVASDAPSQAMRGRLKKGLRGRHLLEAARLAALVKMVQLKMYVIIGLPGETDADIDELIAFSLELQRIVPRVAIGASPFVPKLHTPLGDAAFTDIDVHERRIARLRNGLHGKVEIRSVSPKWAWVEYRLSQGGEETGLAAYAAWKAGGRFADYKRAFRDTTRDERRALDDARTHALWAPAGMK